MKVALYQNITKKILKEKEVRFLGYDTSKEKYPMYKFKGDYYALDYKGVGDNLKVVVVEAPKKILNKYINNNLIQSKIKLENNNTCYVYFQHRFDVYQSMENGFKNENISIHLKDIPKVDVKDLF